jgi:Domain of unknown function (DUF4440)
MPASTTRDGSSDEHAALPPALREELVAIEWSLWQNDPDGYYQRYSPTALLVFPQVGRIDRDAAVAAIRRENADGRSWAEVTIDDVDGRWISDDVALMTYHVRARWNYESVASTYLCSTVYVKSEGIWRVALHQQTPA